MLICLIISHSAPRTAQRDTSGASSCNNIQPGFGSFVEERLGVQHMWSEYIQRKTGAPMSYPYKCQERQGKRVVPKYMLI